MYCYGKYLLRNTLKMCFIIQILGDKKQEEMIE